MAEARPARASSPCFSLISLNLEATWLRASSHVAASNPSPRLIRGVVSLSGEFTQSYPNLPLTQRLPVFSTPSSAPRTFTIMPSLV